MTFEEWSAKYLVSTFENPMSNLFNFELEIKPLKFSRNNLLPTLLRELSEKEDIASLVPNETVNRSLSEAEMDLLKISNDVFGDPALSARISDSFIKEMPSIDAVAITEAQAKDLEKPVEKIIAALKSLNNNAANEIITLLKYEHISEVTSNSFYDKKNVQLIIRLLLNEIFNLYSDDSRRLGQLYKISNTLKKDCARFDAIHYLLLNRDVLDAAIDPELHFERYGRDEGRFSCFRVKE